jgi:hypothetical protein
MTSKRGAEPRKTLVAFIRWIGIAALAVLVVGVISRFVPSTSVKRQVVSQKEPVRLAVADFKESPEGPLDANSEISGEYLGLCRKNSIHSVADFRKTVQNDPVLSNHFSGFDWDAAKLGNQDKALWTFVSYRRGDDINRTSKPVRLAKGDQYITDGNRTVRTFCCNDYVLAPPPDKVAMISSENAAVERVDGPSPRPKDPSERVDGPSRRVLPGVADDESLPDAVPESLKNIQSFTDFPKAFGGRSFSAISSPKRPTPSAPAIKPPAVPEPGTFFQVGAGLICALFLMFRRNRAKRQ